MQRITTQRTNLVERIKKGREQAFLARRNKFYRRATRQYEKFNNRIDKSHKTLNSAWRWAKALAFLSIAAIMFGFYQSMKYFDLYDKLLVEYELVVEMKKKSSELFKAKKKNAELIEESEALDEEMKAMSAGLRLMEFMTENQTDDGNIYCPTCNRKI